MSIIVTILLICLALFVAANIFLVWASADVGSNVYVKAYCKGQTEQRCVALTFDDGPHAKNTAKVLDVLKRHEVRATFFLVGENVERHPELVARMVGEGHIVANHTLSHDAKFPLWSRIKMEDNIMACSDAIYRAAGRRTRLFRPPFGVTVPAIGKAMSALGHNVIGWSIRSYDTMRRSSRKSVAKRVIKRLHPGAIILLHDRCEGAEELLEDIITQGRARGYSFVALDELLNIQVYED